MKKKIKVNRFLQDPNCCAIAAITTIANYYNKDIDYRIAKSITRKKVLKDFKKEGLESGEMGLLLNYLGFNKVTIISSDVDFLDYSWRNFSKAKLIKKLREFCSVTRDRVRARCIMNWLSEKSFDNNLIIDYNFGDYIRAEIDSGRPVLVTFNWTIFFRYYKVTKKMKDDIKGDYEEHAVVLYSYNKKGVKICDSHNQFYKYKLKKYQDGFYFMSWENLMTTMNFGDVYISENYSKDSFERYCK